MPELPEVETTRRGLAPHLTGRRIAKVVVRNAALRWPVDPALGRILPGLAIESLERRGKYLLLDCGRGTLILHLGMSGSLRFLAKPEPPGPWDHFELGLENDGVLRLTDPRRFGAVLWATGDPRAHPLLAHLGPEPLSAAFDGAALHRATRGRSAAIKQVIMDAHVVVGVGNIYASEALFAAGIDPRTPAHRLGPKRCGRLAIAIKETLERAIDAGGSSLRDFVQPDGRPGYFQQQYAVYGREGERCGRCGGVIRRIVQGQRSTCFCPRCQR